MGRWISGGRIFGGFGWIKFGIVCKSYWFWWVCRDFNWFVGSDLGSCWWKVGWIVCVGGWIGRLWNFFGVMGMFFWRWVYGFCCWRLWVVFIFWWRNYGVNLWIVD